MNIHLTSKTLIFFIIFLLFLAVPFIYFDFLLHNNNFLLSNVFFNYLIMMFFGISFAVFIERAFRNKVEDDTKHSAFVFAIIGLVCYALYLLLMTWSRYENFVSEVIDLHYFHQTIWQLSEFKVPYIWGLDQRSFAIWSQHFSPILVFLAPFYWFGKSAGFLMFVQAVAVISGAYPMYLIAKKYLKARSIGLALGFAYLAFGGLQFGFAYGFHEIMFFPPLFLWTYYFYLCKKTKSYFLFIFLSLLVKEEVAFIIGAWSIYLLFVKKDKFFGFISAAFAIGWYLLCFHLIFPYFNPGGFGYWAQYSNGESGAIGIITYILFNPLGFLQTLITPTIKIETFLQTFGSFSFLLFLYPPSVLIVLPSLLEKLLSSGIAMGNGAHYSAAIAAVTIVATFEAFPKFYQYRFINKFIHEKNIFFAVLIVYVALFSTIVYGYRGYSLIPIIHTSIYERGLTENNRRLLGSILDVIPENATISSQYQITPHINKHYKKITTWPGTVGTEDFIIIDTELLPVLGATSEMYNKEIEKINKNDNYQLAVSEFGLLVYRKKSFIPN